MKRMCLYIVAMLVSISLIGCGTNVQSGIKDYNDDDIVAIVKNKKITIGELRFLYPDEKVLGNVEGTVKAELVMQEAKRMELDVSDEIKQTIETMTALHTADIDNPTKKSDHEFVESQAGKFGMKPEVYYEKYVEIMAEQISYLNAYTKKMLGKPDVNSDKAIEEYNKKANNLLSELVGEHEDEIEILAK